MACNFRNRINLVEFDALSVCGKWVVYIEISHLMTMKKRTMRRNGILKQRHSDDDDGMEKVAVVRYRCDC